MNHRLSKQQQLSLADQSNAIRLKLIEKLSPIMDDMVDLAISSHNSGAFSLIQSGKMESAEDIGVVRYSGSFHATHRINKAHDPDDPNNPNPPTLLVSALVQLIVSFPKLGNLQVSRQVTYGSEEFGQIAKLRGQQDRFSFDGVTSTLYIEEVGAVVDAIADANLLSSPTFTLSM